MDTNSEIDHIVFFDGICNLCNSSVNFVIARDSKAFFKFAPLQSDCASEKLKKIHIDSLELESIIFLSNGKIYRKSRAALEIARKLNGLWPMMYGFIIIPSFIRDIFYSLIAKNRYKWFGKQDSCKIPTPELADRFINY